LLQVLGSLVGGRSSSRNSPKRCEACRKEQAGKSTSFKDKPSSSSQQQQQHQCPHKHVQFSETVAAVYIPVHREYSNRVRQSYWASAGEIREMVYRNMLEFDAEGYSWRHVAEEEDMYFCEETKEFIHPVFFDTPQEEGAGDDATVAVDGNSQVIATYINIYCLINCAEEVKMRVTAFSTTASACSSDAVSTSGAVLSLL
jgi:hypothetical protein